MRHFGYGVNSTADKSAVRVHAHVVQRSIVTIAVQPVGLVTGLETGPEHPRLRA